MALLIYMVVENKTCPPHWVGEWTESSSFGTARRIPQCLPSLSGLCDANVMLMFMIGLLCNACEVTYDAICYDWFCY